jgi:hypothetical protein
LSRQPILLGKLQGQILITLNSEQKPGKEINFSEANVKKYFN